MSNFLTNHPNLAIVFNGAVKSVTNRRNLLIGAGAVGAPTLFVAFAVAAAMAPYAAIGGIAAYAVFEGFLGVCDARNKLKTEKELNKAVADELGLSAEALQIANDKTTDAMASRAKEALKISIRPGLRHPLHRRSPQ